MENPNKYRALHDFVSDPAKAELFGMGGLFGGFKENHTVLKLFATFVNESKRKYHHIPNTVNSQTFIEYIGSEPTLDEAKKEAIVKKIEYIHKKGVIQNQPIARNTLYNFALVLDDLNIGEKQELILSQYERALEGALQLKDVAQKVETETLDGQTKARASTATGEAVVDTTRPAAKEFVSPFSVTFSIPGNETAPRPTEDQELSVKEKVEADVDARTMPASAATPYGQTLPVAPTTSTVSLPETLPAKGQEVLDRPGTGSQTDNGLNKPTIFGGNNDENPQEPQGEKVTKIQQPEETIEIAGLSPLPFEERVQVPGVISVRQIVPAGRQAMPRRVIVSGKDLRKSMTQPERLKELPAQETKKAKTKTPETQQADQQELNPQRSTIETGANIRDEGKTSSLGKKLAKLAGAGVGAGVILPLFAGGSAKAADFSFIQKIISLIF